MTVGLLLTSVSCNKISNFSKLDTLVDKEWKLTGISQNGIEISEPCDFDNTILLKANSDVTNNFGAINCEEREMDASKWKFADDYSVIKFKLEVKEGRSYGATWGAWEIIELTDTTLVLKEKDSNSAEMPVIRSYKFN